MKDTDRKMLDNNEQSIPEQYMRTGLVLGSDGLRRLQNSCVLFAGLGAVGSYALEALARAGVGTFRLIDFDVVQESNINRQLLATHASLGRRKTDVARERILAINPRAKIETRDELINAKTVASFFDGDWATPPDYVIDAIDSLGPKVALIAEALRRGVPLMSSMGAALRVDASLPSVGRLTDVSYCPLAAQIRKRLRRVGVNTDDVRCVYSPEPIRENLRAGNDRLARVEPAKELTPDQLDSPPGRPRNTLGSLPTIVGIFGLRIAHEVMLELSGFGKGNADDK